MIDKKDWRLTNQENYLYQKPLRKGPYTIYRKGWEHDHCCFCSKTIDSRAPVAYCTADQYYWICEACYHDFKDMFQWEMFK